MTIKDSVTSWFIQNIVLPNAEDIRNPGYILSKFTDKGKEISLREFLFPERFYSEFETKIVKALGRKGRQRLYSIGKRFGYRYAMISRYNRLSTLKKKGLEDFMYLSARYIEVMYARKLEHRIDFEKRLITVSADSYVGCEKNGLGYLLLIGSWTGVWSYLIEDSTVEGIQLECQGRGDKICRLVCAPIAELKEIGNIGTDIVSEPDISGLEEGYSKYEFMNRVYPSANKNSSLKTLIETGTFRYDRGKLFFGSERMVGIEFSTYYMIDNGFSKDKLTRKILYDTAFEAGKEIGSGKDPLFVQRFLSSLGFGDAQVIMEKGRFKVRLFHFPWSSMANGCDFTILSGFTSGLLSGASKKTQEFKVTAYEGSDGFHIKMD